MTNSLVQRHSDFEKFNVPEMESMHMNAPSSSKMNCTYPPHSKNHKNKGNTVSGTNEPLYSSFARAYFLSAWDIVTAIVSLCIYL